MTKNNDPTRAEMLAFLAGLYEGEASDFDREEAIYWFANDWHGGQWSNLYSALSTSPYRPGPISNGPEPDSIADWLIGELQGEYAP